MIAHGIHPTLPFGPALESLEPVEQEGLRAEGCRSLFWGKKSCPKVLKAEEEYKTCPEPAEWIQKRRRRTPQISGISGSATIHQKYKKYKDGKIDEFIKSERKKDICEIDPATLKNTHRNNKKNLYLLLKKLFPNFEKCEPCDCKECRSYEVEHEGVFLVKPQDVEL